MLLSHNRNDVLDENQPNQDFVNFSSVIRRYYAESFPFPEK